jgi:hypothetical protein
MDLTHEPPDIENDERSRLELLAPPETEKGMVDGTKELDSESAGVDEISPSEDDLVLCIVLLLRNSAPRLPERARPT